MTKLHEVQDETKVAELAESMEQNGWQGAPLVIDGDQLFTGVHRYTAAHDLLNWYDYQIPTISVEDVFEEAGRDFSEEFEDAQDLYSDAITCIVNLLDSMPREIKDKYGIDCH